MSLGGIEQVEFFFEHNTEFPFIFNSEEFLKVVEERKFIFIHNSFPHSQERTLFPLQVVNEMKSILEGKVTVIRFSGQMYRRGYDDDQIKETKKEQLKRGQPLVEKDLMVERDDLYENFDMFIRYWMRFSQSPNYFILKYGVEANRGKAQEIEVKMRSNCMEEYIEIPTLSVSNLHNHTFSKNVLKKRLKANWKSSIELYFLEICDIAGFSQERKEKALNYLSADHVLYNKYFETVQKVINNEIKDLPK